MLILADKTKAVSVTCYPDKPTNGTRFIVYRDGKVKTENYKRKRFNGIRSRYVAKSAKGGVV